MMMTIGLRLSPNQIGPAFLYALLLLQNVQGFVAPLIRTQQPFLPPLAQQADGDGGMDATARALLAYQTVAQPPPTTVTTTTTTIDSNKPLQEVQQDTDQQALPYPDAFFEDQLLDSRKSDRQDDATTESVFDFDEGGTNSLNGGFSSVNTATNPDPVPSEQSDSPKMATIMNEDANAVRLLDQELPSNEDLQFEQSATQPMDKYVDVKEEKDEQQLMEQIADNDGNVWSEKEPTIPSIEVGSDENLQIDKQQFMGQMNGDEDRKIDRVQLSPDNEAARAIHDEKMSSKKERLDIDNTAPIETKPDEVSTSKVVDDEILYVDEQPSSSKLTEDLESIPLRNVDAKEAPTASSDIATPLKKEEVNERILNMEEVKQERAVAEAKITTVTSLSSSKVNSVVATTRTKQRLKEEEESKPNFLLQMIGDMIFADKDDSNPKSPTPPTTQKESALLKDFAEKLTSSVKTEKDRDPNAAPMVLPPDAYYFNVNTQRGRWNPKEDDEVFTESSDRQWTASLDSRGNFWVYYYDNEDNPGLPIKTGKGTDDWDQYQNASGRVYFVNRVTGESQWLVPEGFKVIDTQKEEKTGEKETRAAKSDVERTKQRRSNEDDLVEPKELTPIQRLLGKMNQAEKAELSAVATVDSPEVSRPENSQNSLPSPIQRLLGQKQQAEEVKPSQTATSNVKPTPIQRLFNQQKEMNEALEKSGTKDQNAPKSPFWVQPVKTKEEPPKKSGKMRPFWAPKAKDSDQA